MPVMTREGAIEEMIEGEIDCIRQGFEEGDLWYLDQKLRTGFKGFDNYTDEELQEEYINLIQDEELELVKVGDSVYWNDPENGISSGEYKIVSIETPEICLISNGTSEAEVPVYELIKKEV